MNTHATPPLRRRLASMLYESMLIFAVLFIFGGLFSIVMEQKHALYLRGLMQDWLLLLLGLYFVWFWTHGGQTLAMQTWRIRLVTTDGSPVGIKRALGRFFLSWLWVMPGLVAAWAFGAKEWLLVLIPAANVALWALATFLDPQRQFLHDRIAGTRLIAFEPTGKKSAK
ncbi:RDD family protein [Noviherbaspirillum denitrificans]|uniref:RDD domain-containing protein n=1 Tax=Noviherbaspirillum denitrificans TaxID=1968433 RepID=A0A254T8P5_9BURK|nr:RDD family protein [Noviherbaspirillum denitrificans]OWW18527.1 hypothetical protein AYR66_00265 [Noviherbaspirillum denitrificans]